MRHTKKSRTQWYRPPFFRVRVSGESMYPTLLPGRTYWASGWLLIRVGDYAVFRNSRNSAETWVKRVKAVREDGYEVEGLASWSTPSEKIGVIPRRFMLGRLLRSHP